MFDDDETNLDNFEATIATFGIGLTFRGFDSVESFRDGFNSLKDQTKVVIFDLKQTDEEERKNSYEISRDIQANFDDYRMIIFIHSALSKKFEGFDNKGTVFKVVKGGNAVQEICEKIKLMEDSGFLDVFCQRGILETTLIGELHNAFTEQFKGDEIANVIKSVDPSKPDYKERVRDIFKRHALRSLINNLVIPAGSQEVKINPIEHNYRRNRANNPEIWTGDIFKKKGLSEYLLVMTARCDAEDCGDVVICSIIPTDCDLNNPSILSRVMNDNPNLTKGTGRFLMKTPMFCGGKVDYTSYKTVPRGTLLSDDYEYVITLGDQLINDIIRKCSAYKSREGVQAMDEYEVKKFLQM